SLSVASGHMIYADTTGVQLIRADVPPALFTTLPPRNHEEWLALGRRLAANRRDFAPGDFKAMMQQFAGPETQITGASLRDYRLIGENGFRFVLSLQPNFRVQASDLFDVRALEPGDYAVTYDGHFTIERLTPPRLAASVAGIPLTQLSQNSVQVALRNDGLQDLPEATLELWAAPPQGPATIVATQTVTLLAHAPITPTLQWAPSAAGQWTLTPRIRRPDGQAITLEGARITVLPVQAIRPEELAAASTAPDALPFVLLGLVALAAMAALVFWRQWTPVEQVDDAA